MVLLGIAVEGPGSNDEERLKELLRDQSYRLFDIHRSTTWAKAWSAARLFMHLRQNRYDLAVLEGPGISAGLPLLLAKARGGPRYLVGSGDAIGPYVAGRAPALGRLFLAYERALYRHSAGVIAWTPYIAGRALTFGAPRGVTIPGWPAYPLSAEETSRARQSVRDRLGISDSSVVVGLVGSLRWNHQHRYCYGAELIRAAARLQRKDLVVVVIGGGSGLEHLRNESAGAPWARLIGPVPREEVSSYLAAMDLASLPQSVDQVGSFRYSTKLPEYLAAGLPIVTGQLPAAYDLGLDAFFRLPGDAPWSEEYVRALTAFLECLRPEYLQKAAASASKLCVMFEREEQRRRLNTFLYDVLSPSRVVQPPGRPAPTGDPGPSAPS